MTNKENVRSLKYPEGTTVEAVGAFGIDRKWWVLIAVGVGTLMSALGASSLNAILPVINTSLNSDVTTIVWVVTAHQLVIVGLLLSFGRLGDLRGIRSVYLLGFIIYVFSSALCGLVSSVETLIAFRILQGLGAAMLFAQSPALLTINFPESQRGQALGLRAILTYVGLLLGPSLGGWLAENVGWRAIFFINVPIGLIAIFLSLHFIPRDVVDKRTGKFDLTGATISIVGLAVFLLALNRGYNWGWTSPPILILLVIGVLLLIAFLIVERRVMDPMLDLKLFRDRLFSASAASAVLNFICTSSVTFLLPFYLIEGRGLSPSHAGLLLTAQPITMVIIAPLSGTLSDRIGVRLPRTLGMVILAAGLYLLSRLGPQSSLLNVSSGLVIVGLGTGAFISPNNSALMGAAPRSQQGIAGSILAMARNLGFAMGVTLAGAVYNTILVQGRLSSSDFALFEAVSTGFRMAIAVAFVGSLLSSIRGREPETL